MSAVSNKNIFPIYIPLLFAYGLSSAPIISFFIAWLGSFFIFFWTWSAKNSIYQEDLKLSAQLMRPLFLLQLIFAGFMACTSIFYFLDHLGYQYLTRINSSFFRENHQTELIAQCQRLALLAHVGLVHGMISKIHKSKTSTLAFQLNVSDNFLIGFCIWMYALGLVFQRIEGLTQLSLIFSAMAVSAGTLLFVKGFIERNTKFLLIGATVFAINFLNATLSGFKEPIIVNILLLGILFYPHFKRIVLLLGLPTIYILLYILPTYASVVRKSWSGETSAEEARSQAIEVLQSNENEDTIDETNWDFLTGRLSEINMFTQFADFVPAKHNYYGWTLVEQAFYSFIPRVIWPDKPITESIAMERVYDAGIVDRNSIVSAKTRPIVDAYLSWGTIGVYFFMLLYGMLAQSLCNWCEQHFGGYQFGCIVMFNSLFQAMWRGNNFEFMFTNIFYGVIMMHLLFFLFKRLKLIQAVR